MPKIEEMKKLFCLFIIFSISAFIFSQNQQDSYLNELSGVWENSSRFVVVNNDSLSFVLKTFYGFYYDEVAVLPAFLTTSETGETLLEINYKGVKQPQVFPIGVINNKLFLDFYCKGSAFDNVSSSDDQNQIENDSESPLQGFWRCSGNVLGIEVALPQIKNEVTCYYFTDEEVYLLRYWKVDLPYTKEYATATDGDFSFTVDKLLKIGDVVYSCTVGRGTQIRNLKKCAYKIEGDTILFELDGEKPKPFSFSQDGSLLSFSDPYLTKSTIADLNAEIKEHNSLTHNPFKNPLEVFERKTAWEKKLDAIDVEKLRAEAEEIRKDLDNY